MSRLPTGLTYNDLNGREAADALQDWFRQLLASQPLLQPHLTLPMASIRLSVKVDVDMYVGGSVPASSPPERAAFDGSFQLDNNITEGGAPPPRTEEAKAEAFSHARSLAPPPERTESMLDAIINAAPIPGGEPPDRIRAKHGIPIPRPSVGPRETGSHVVIADLPVPDATGGRRGHVDPSYRFSEQVAPVGNDAHQTIPVGKGQVEIDLAGEGIDHAGIHVSAGTHVSSVKKFGDQAGKPYESVNSVYDAGPAGLMSGGGGAKGLGGDGRPRLSFGNSQRG
jgi:hypothetical protein